MAMTNRVARVDTVVLETLRLRNGAGATVDNIAQRLQFPHATVLYGLTRLMGVGLVKRDAGGMYRLVGSALQSVDRALSLSEQLIDLFATVRSCEFEWEFAVEINPLSNED